MRVLIDVANGRVSTELIETLARAGHTVERGHAPTAKDFDLLVIGSVEVAERLQRERPDVPVIVFTKVGDVTARVRALEAGAADAVDASFAHSQIAARVGAAGRRSAMVPKPPERLELDGCVLDLAAATGSRDGVAFALTYREVEIVRWLVRHAGRVVARDELLRHVWGVSPNNETRAVDVAIAGLRAKLERDPRAPAIIVSIKGAGYRWGS